VSIDPAYRDSSAGDEPKCRAHLTERDRSDRESDDENDNLCSDEPACQQSNVRVRTSGSRVVSKTTASKSAIRLGPRSPVCASSRT
jgi:hypothetical protein